MVGIEAMGIDAIGIEAIGEPATAIDAIGIEAIGEPATAIEAIGIDAIGIDAMGIDAIGIDAIGIDAIGAPSMPIEAIVAAPTLEPSPSTPPLHVNPAAASALHQSVRFWAPVLPSSGRSDRRSGPSAIDAIGIEAIGLEARPTSFSVSPVSERRHLQQRPCERRALQARVPAAGRAQRDRRQGDTADDVEQGGREAD
jgi:hypothetical protein